MALALSIHRFLQARAGPSRVSARLTLNEDLLSAHSSLHLGTVGHWPEEAGCGDRQEGSSDRCWASRAAMGGGPALGELSRRQGAGVSGVG